jgi:ferrous iron transport protein A
MNHLPLSQLCNGQRARVTRLSSDTPADQRLLALGLAPGAVVECAAIAPLADPVAFAFQNQILSIRRADAFSVKVEPL